MKTPVFSQYIYQPMLLLIDEKSGILLDYKQIKQTVGSGDTLIIEWELPIVFNDKRKVKYE